MLRNPINIPGVVTVRSLARQSVLNGLKPKGSCPSLIRGPERNLARDMAIYLARDLTGESAQRLGTYFGAISGAGITMRYKHMA